MLIKATLYILLTTIFAGIVSGRNAPINEETAKAQLIEVINDHCKLIHFDKKSINQLINYFHMKEDIENVTACDLACDAYATSKAELADVILKSDGDLFYAIKSINGLFSTELLQLQNDIITINIYGFNSISQRTANYSVEQFGQKNKVAAYMLKNLLDVQNRTNYPVLKEHISRIQIPAEEIVLTLLPTIDSYHKFMRGNEMRDEIDYEEHAYHYDDEFTDFEDQQSTESPGNDKENNAEGVENSNRTKSEENNTKGNVETVKTTERSEEVMTTMKEPEGKDVPSKESVEEASDSADEDQPRLIEQFINSDLPLVKLREEQAQAKHKDDVAHYEANKGRARELMIDNPELKGLYDTDDLDYAGIHNVGRARLEQNAARNAFGDDDYNNYQINTRDMGDDYSDESPEVADERTGNQNAPQQTETQKPNKPQEEVKEKPAENSNSNKETPKTNSNNAPDDDDYPVQGRDTPAKKYEADDSDEGPPGSRDFFVTYESGEDDSNDQKSSPSSSSGSGGGLFSFMTNPIKKGLSGVLKFGSKAVNGILNDANKLAVSAISQPEGWLDRMVNYPKNFAILRVIDGIHGAKKWMNKVLTPMIDGLEGKNNANDKDKDSRGTNPFSMITNPIKNSIKAFVRSIGDGIINSVGRIPFVGGMIATGVNSTLLFMDGFINRMLP